MKNLLGILGGAGAGSLPGLLVLYLVWFPLRVWLFSQIPVEAQWAFFAKLASIVVLFFTVGGAFPIWLLFVGIVLGAKLGDELTKPPRYF